MNNPFVDLKVIHAADPTRNQGMWKLSDQDRKHKRDLLYSQYTLLVYTVLDQLIAAYQPGIWKKGSDCDHAYCCHCRWYAGPEETRHAHYDDHAIRRAIEIQLDINEQCDPAGFKILYHNNPGRCVHVGLSQAELVRGIQAVLY